MLSTHRIPRTPHHRTLHRRIPTPQKGAGNEAGALFRVVLHD